MDSPAISVVMSVFNGEPFLREAVESILAQTFGDFEFIIIDDGSTDTTPQILTSYANCDDRIRIFAQQNRGLVRSLNRGIGLSRAPYIARIDADDVATPDRLERQINFLRTHADVGLLSGAFVLIDEKGHLICTMRLPLDDLRTVIRNENAVCHPAVMMRKDLVLALGGYREAVVDAEDYDLWLRIAERASLANLNEVILRYRIHSSQLSIQNVKQQIWSFLAARAAASHRARGLPDPLTHGVAITPQLLAELGVPSADIDQALVRAYKDRIDLLRRIAPDAALRINSALSALSRSDSLNAAARAEMWFRLAATRSRQGKLAAALVAAGRGVFTHPFTAGRPAKRAFMRLLASLVPSRS